MPESLLDKATRLNLRPGFLQSQPQQAPQPLAAKAADQQGTDNDGTGVVGSVADFLGVKKFGQGIASSIRDVSGADNQTKDIAGQDLENAVRLIQAARKYPVGSPQRKQILLQAARLRQGQMTMEQVDPGTKLTNRDVIGSALQTSAFFMRNPYAAGATFGAGSGIERGSGVVGTATESVLTALGTKVLDKTVSKLFDHVAPSLSRYLERLNLRLTPTQKFNLGSKLSDITEFLSRHKVVGAPETRFEKVDALYDKTEQVFQHFLDTEAKDRTVPKDQTVQFLEQLKSQFKNDADRLDIGKQIDRAIANLETRFSGNDVPVKDLNELKRSVFKQAYNKAGTKVRDDVEHAIGDVYKTVIEDATKGLTIQGKDVESFNREYGTLINARKLLKIAQTRPQIGLVGKLVASFAGGAIGEKLGGGVLGEIIGASLGGTLGETVAGTATRSAVSAGLRKASETGGKGLSKLAPPLARSTQPRRKKLRNSLTK